MSPVQAGTRRQSFEATPAGPISVDWRVRSWARSYIESGHAVKATQPDWQQRIARALREAAGKAAPRGESVQLEISIECRLAGLSQIGGERRRGRQREFGAFRREIADPG
jgi:hypothetical protein